MTVEQALREALAAHEAVILLDPAKGYHFGSGPSIEELAKSIEARLAAPVAAPAEGRVLDVDRLADALHQTAPFNHNLGEGPLRAICEEDKE